MGFFSFEANWHRKLTELRRSHPVPGLKPCFVQRLNAPVRLEDTGARCVLERFQSGQELHRDHA